MKTKRSFNVSNNKIVKPQSTIFPKNQHLPRVALTHTCTHATTADITNNILYTSSLLWKNADDENGV